MVKHLPGFPVIKTPDGSILPGQPSSPPDVAAPRGQLLMRRAKGRRGEEMDYGGFMLDTTRDRNPRKQPKMAERDEKARQRA